MNNCVLEVENLSFSYGSKQILKDINLKIRAGEYISIIGPNGVGKSTLLKSIIRIVRGFSGSIKLMGKDLTDYTQKELGRLIGYVSQSREQAFPYTVLEFVNMGRYPHLNPLARLSRQDKQIVEESLKLTGLEDFCDRRVINLSGGERQKVTIAGALAQRPKILLLDEPTTHLDPKYHAEIQQTVCKISKELGITVIHVTHDLNHIQFWSQRVIALRSGEIIYEGDPAEVLNEKSLKDIFDIEFLLVSHPSKLKKIVIPEVFE